MTGEGPRFRELLEALPLPALILDAHGRILFSNRLLTELVGLPLAELIGSDAFDLNPAEDRRVLRTMFTRDVRNGVLPAQIESSIIAANGERRVILWSVATVRDPGVDGSGAVVEIVGVGQDITERRVLERQRAQLAALVETTPAATMAFDVDRTVRVWNPAAERIFGWTAEEVVGQPLPPMVRPQDVETGVDRIRRTLMGEAIRGDRVVRLTKDGRERQIEIWAARIVDSSGRPTGIAGQMIDVTERVALENSRATFEAMVGASPDFIAIARPDESIVYLNPAGRRLVGLTEDGPLPPGLAIRDFHSPAGYRSIREHELPGLLAPAGRWSGDSELRHFQTFEDIPVRASSFVVRDADGATSFVATIRQDDRPRRLAEHERAVAEARFHELLETVDLCAMILDTSGRIVFVNEFLADLLHWTSAELVGRDWFETVRPEAVRADGRDWLAGLVAGTGLVERRHENDIVTRSGNLRTVRWNTTVLRDLAGAVIGVAGVGEDVTERRDTEAERSRLAAAVTQAGDMVLIADVEGRIEFVNPAFEAITGYPAAEVLGRTVDSVLRSGTHPPSFYAGMEAAFRRGESWADTITDRRRDGSLFEVNLRISPIRDAAGDVVGFVHVSRDLTQERILEGQLRQALKMEAVGQLAGGVAHDFNNMLTAIRGYAEILRTGLPDDDSTNREDLEQIVLTADRAAALTRQLLAFARKQVVEPRVLDPAEIVAAIAPMLRRLLGEHIELVVDSPLGEALIRIDPNQLEQIVLNLGVNARDAMPDGGRLVISTMTLDIDDQDDVIGQGVRPGSHLVLSVSDTGTGIEPAMQDRIFEPFFTTKALGQGTGMGLATVHGIVDQAGGTICLESAPRKGTTFRVFVPRVTDAGPTPTIHERIGVVARGNETILLVEDERAVRGFASRTLRQLGYTVLEASHADEAIAIAQELTDPLELLLTDVSMPGMRGTELATRLAARQPGLRVLLMSGFADSSILDTALLDGNTGYLPKPYSSEGLAQAVRAALD